jgi:hypothetical protein
MILGQIVNAWFLALECKGDDGVAVFAGSSFHPRYQVCLEIIGFRAKFARGDLLLRSSMEAKLADAEAAFGTHWWTKYTAGHRTRCVQLASAGLRIEHWARFVIPKFLEILVPLGENSYGSISRKIGR